MEVLNTTSTIDPTFYYNYFNNIITNPIIIVIIVLIIVGFLIFSSSLGSSQNIGFGETNVSSNENNIFIIITGILVILFLFNLFQYFFSINITAYINDFFSSSPKLDINVNQPTPQSQSQPQPVPVPEIKFRKQVFNIPGNYYNYQNAKSLCSAYGAKLATYDQVEDSYNNGGEWCNYGWSEGQMALFPTQKSTYKQLQKISGHEHDCGRPGVNGGYIANPQVQFGVNCYGDKPDITKKEEQLLETVPRYPQNNEDLQFDKQVEYWKTQIDNILVSPFNNNNWSQV